MPGGVGGERSVMIAPYPDPVALTTPSGGRALSSRVSRRIRRLGEPKTEVTVRLTSRILLGIAGMVFAAQVCAQITLYEGEGFRGRVFSTNGPADNFATLGFNDRASSAIVDRGRWEVCEHAQYQGRCVVLRQGNYHTLASMGLNDQISSVRPAPRQAHYAYEAPPPPRVPVYEYRQRPHERLYQANVTLVRAVVGPPQQRCWVERQQVVEDRPAGANVPGAIAGAVIGGILGHQVGGGHGQDVATAGGAVAGAAIGANAGRGSGPVYTQDVQRCRIVPASTRPSYWDVTYYFRGQEHRVQMGAPPGPTITVNGKGEPRG